MRRFQNATMEYNVAKNELVIRDVNNNGIFFAIDFFENSKQNQNGEQSVLNLLLELDQLVSDKRTVINISNDDLSNITLN